MQIRYARPDDAPDVVRTFRQEFEEYFPYYVEEDKNRSFLRRMQRDLEGDGRPEEIVLVLEYEDEHAGVGAVKLQDHRIELGSTILRPKFRGETLEDGQSLFERFAMRGIEIAVNRVQNDSEPARMIYSELLADQSALTQYAMSRVDFGVTGIYDKKKMTVYSEKGRGTLVDQLWADSRIPTDNRKVYLPPEKHDLVKLVLKNLNEKRSDDPIERDLSDGDIDPGNQRFQVEKSVEGEPINKAELQVTVSDSGNYDWSDVLKELSETQNNLDNDEDDYWIGLSLDANHPSARGSIEELQDVGFDVVGFNPARLQKDQQLRDAFELQYSPDSCCYVTHFTHEAAKLVRESDLCYKIPEIITEYDTSEALAV
ncbi:MAG: hypothetical protein ABEK50_06545 [bacterium]